MVTILVSSKLPTAHSVNLATAAALQHKRLLGKINLIDLAGSENNKSANGKDAVRMAESAAINKSLSVLGQVINAINSGAVRINTVRKNECSSIASDRGEFLTAIVNSQGS